MLARRFFALAALLAVVAPARAEPVDLELGLLIDVSGSVDATEFALQRGGYVSAFRKATVQNAITASPNGVAVSLIYWSSSNEQQQAVGWTLLKTAADADAFANAIEATSRPFSGLTGIGAGLNFATPLFSGNGYEGTRLVIDVSGDGEDNDSNLAAARANALAAGISINGIAIGDPALLNYYQNNVIGGANSFALGATTFQDFEAAIETKLKAEINNEPPVIPAPPALALAAFAGLTLGVRRWRTKRAAD